MPEEQLENQKARGLCRHGNFSKVCLECKKERLIEVERYLQDYLKPNGSEFAEAVKVTEASSLPEGYSAQYDFLNDERLAETLVVIVPDVLWVKGDQPSESHAVKNLVLFRETYFTSGDRIGWMSHELAHCQKFMDEPGMPEEQARLYEKESATPAFIDAGTELPYPNNIVEAHAFGRQFEYLKSKGFTRHEVVKMLEPYYGQKDFPFFEELLDRVY